MKKQVFSPFLGVTLMTGIVLSFPAYPLDGTLAIGAINGGNWQLQGVHTDLSPVSKNPQTLALTINALTPPKPFDTLRFINIRCGTFLWQNGRVSCEQGRAEMRSQCGQSPTAHFSFHLGDQPRSFKLTDLQLAGGLINLIGEEKNDQWHIQLDANEVAGALIAPLLPSNLFELSGGNISLKLKITISQQTVQQLALTVRLNELSAQSKDGRFATEKLSLEAALKAVNNNGVWQWQSHSQLAGGALYAQPVYLQTAGQNIVLNAAGSWHQANQALDIAWFSYQHAPVATLSGNMRLNYRQGLAVEQARLSLRSEDLHTLSSRYLQPFFQQTRLEGLALAGAITADFSIVKQSLTALSANIEHLDINDTAGRVGIKGGEAVLNWSNDNALTQTSHIAWQQLSLFNLPVEAAKLSFSSKENAFKLLGKARLPFLGGSLAVSHFEWQANKPPDQSPHITFAGNVNQLSLDALSTALGWTPLSGYISGKIPNVEYKNNTLSLDGELAINVFDGVIKVTQLASTGLFSDFPVFYSDVEIDNLDLDRLTRRFEFGRITGRLSGFVRKLRLENWRPVTFYAWLGTPDDDDSSHKVSQKAIKNIANIGGGGVSDALSKSFLNLFETFSYDKIGIGCYLHEGRCQLMGVEAVGSGYAIIKGGGLPRLDVIGYHSQLDWNVLLERLSRIASTDDVIIK